MMVFLTDTALQPDINVPGCRLNSRNVPGACSYQWLKKLSWINEPQKCNTTKYFMRITFNVKTSQSTVL